MTVKTKDPIMGEDLKTDEDIHISVEKGTPIDREVFSNSTLYKKILEKAPLWTEKDTAAFLKMAPSTLRRWRMLRYGPPFIKRGVSVRYRPEDVEAWVEKGRTATPAASSTG